MKIFNDAPEDFKKAVSDLQKQEEYKKMHEGYKCPNCGMRAGYKIGPISKNKIYKCENCKYMW